MSTRGLRSKGALPRRVLSGGQTGVDRGALDAAIEAGVPCGGWCPAARWAEDGPIPDGYPLTETPSADPADRTRRNVEGGDGTVILHGGSPDVGTELTRATAVSLGRPLLELDLAVCADDKAAEAIDAFVREHEVAVLNVAGPRASAWPAGYARARSVIGMALARR